MVVGYKQDQLGFAHNETFNAGKSISGVIITFLTYDNRKYLFYVEHSDCNPSYSKWVHLFTHLPYLLSFATHKYALTMVLIIIFLMSMKVSLKPFIEIPNKLKILLIFDVYTENKSNGKEIYFS